MKKILAILLIIFILTILISITIFTYKKFNNGNNIINKSEEEIIEDILKVTSYNATIQVEVNTNKNKTKYIARQSLKDNKSTQEIIEPKNIAGIITEYDGQNLKIINNKLELTTTFENYAYIVNNNWWLDSFIEEYKTSNNSKIEHNNNEIILEVKNEVDKKYNTTKKLYIDKNTGKPTKIIIEDINQNIRIYILYTEIEIS